MKPSPPRRHETLDPWAFIFFAAGLALWPSHPVSAQQMRLRAVPELTIGEIDGPVALTHVASLVAVGDTLFLTQALSKEIRVLSVDGEPLATWGRHGDGPGEYQRPARIVFADGLLAVVDESQERVTYLHPDGRVARTRPFPDHRSSTHNFYHPAFVGPGGKVILFATLVRWLPGLDEVRPGLVFDAEGAVIDSLEYRFGKRRIVLENSSGNFSTSYPVIDGAHMATSSDGRWFVLADHLSPEDGLSLIRYEVETWRRDTVHLALPKVRVPRAYADSVEASLMARYEGVVERFGRRAVEEAIRMPETVPAADALFVARDGEIWLRRPSFGVGPDLWLVVKPTGEIRAKVEVPHGMEILAVQGTTLWAHHQDEYWVSYISRLRLEARRN